MTCGIYKITNIKNNHCYIGQSVNIEERWKKHRSIGNNYNLFYTNYPLYNATYKYGIENFLFEIIEECDQFSLDEKEKYWIEYYNSYKDGYNQTLGGMSGHSSKLSLNQVDEIKELLKFSSLSENDIAIKYNVSLISISNINIGKYWNDNTTDYPIRKIDPSKKYYCKKCGKELKNKINKIKSFLCIDCYKEKRNENIPQRQELKNKIRLYSFNSIAKEYGYANGNTVKSWCKKLNLPFLKSDIKKYTDEEWELV